MPSNDRVNSRSDCLILQLMIKDHIIDHPDPLEALEVPQMAVPEQSGSAQVGLSRMAIDRSVGAPVRLGTGELYEVERSSSTLARSSN
jgi:hypothetical protein